MGTERTDGAITRRSVLRRIGAGTAVAWSAPIVLSAVGPAWAGSPSPCAQATVCGLDPVFCFRELNCVCFASTEGDPACVTPIPCGGQVLCSSTAFCQSQFPAEPGVRCVENCCGSFACLAPCGHELP